MQPVKMLQPAEIDTTGENVAAGRNRYSRQRWCSRQKPIQPVKTMQPTETDTTGKNDADSRNRYGRQKLTKAACVLFMDACRLSVSRYRFFYSFSSVPVRN